MELMVFCADEQSDTVHQMEVDKNGEMVLTCNCGQFLKFPSEAVTDEKLFKQLLEGNKLSNAR